MFPSDKMFLIHSKILTWPASLNLLYDLMINTYATTDNLLWFMQPSYNDSLESFKRYIKKNLVTFMEVELCWDWGGGRGGCLLQKKMDKEEVEMGEGGGESSARS